MDSEGEKESFYLRLNQVYPNTHRSKQQKRENENKVKTIG